MLSHTARLLEIMARLRDKQNGCPWDIEQNFATIAPHTIEEAYEVMQAIQDNDMEALKEELGDLLLQVVFHAQMASEEKRFSFDDVAEVICEKLVRRHPHLFGDATIETADEQIAAWEAMKAEERKAKAAKKSGSDFHSVLAEVPIALPALTRAEKLTKRAAANKFDWPDTSGIFAKLDEEIDEIKEAINDKADKATIAEEIGDLLFVVVNLARHLKVDPEAALRNTNKKFESRFHYIEQSLAKQNRTLQDSNLEEMDKLWDEAKVKEK